MNNKKILTKITAVAAVALWFTACSENIETENNGTAQGININVSVRQGWNDAKTKKNAPQTTRASQSDKQMVTQADGTIGGQEVFLWCDELNGIEGKGLTVPVNASIQSEDEATRGTLKNGTLGNDAADEKFHRTFSIYGSKAPGGRSAEWKHDNEWSLSSPFTWTDNNEYDFYAIAPANAAVTDASEAGFTYTVPSTAVEQHDLMVGTSTAKRSDRHMWFDFSHALSAIKFKIGDKGFKSGFNFKKIELQGVSESNTYSFATGTWGTPSGTTNVTSVIAEKNEIKEGKANTMITDDEAGSTFILLPQVLSTDIKVIITLENTNSGNAELEISANLTLTDISEWKPGYSYIYTISSTQFPSDYSFTISGEELVFNHDGTPVASDKFQVTSYKKGTNAPAAWSVEGYQLQNEDGTWPDEWTTTKPDMLNSLSATSGPGGVTATNVTTAVTVESIDEVVNSRRQNELRDPARGEKNIDLSLYKVDNTTSTTRTTANCYIVRYPGKYKFPLVVGNTIQNGVRRTPDMYTTAGASLTQYISRPSSTEENQNIPWYHGYNAFRDYQGRVITSGQTYDNLKSAASFEIIWHDFYDMENKTKLQNVIKNLSFSEDGNYKYLNFEVDKDLIQQGNALLAVKDASGAIMWSWHIYITDLDWTNTITIQNWRNEARKVARENIGYIEHRYNTLYPERKMKIRLLQNESGLTAEVIVTRNEHRIPQLYHRDTKYQWGRKDPFPQPEKDEDFITGTSPVLVPNTSAKLHDFGTNGAISATQNPTKMFNMNYGGHGGWLDASQAYLNLWAANNDGVIMLSSNNVTCGFLAEKFKTTVKTIYDPSPPGFKVMVPVTFTGFQQVSENNHATADQMDLFNVDGDYFQGWNVHCNGNHSATEAERKASETYFLPNTSMISRNGKLSKYGQNGEEQNNTEGGWIWSAIPRMNATDTARYMGVNISFRHNEMRPCVQNVQKCGLSVRPILEE